MRHLIACLLLALTAQTATAQHFVWGSSGTGLHGDFSQSTRDASGNMIVASIIDRYPDFDRGEPALFDRLGTSISITAGLLVAAYIPDGAALAKGVEGSGGCVLSPEPWQLSVYPNPATGPLTFAYRISTPEPNASLTLCDARGKRVASLFAGRVWGGAVAAIEPFDGATLAAGTYVAVLSGTNGAATVRFVVAR